MKLTKTQLKQIIKEELENYYGILDVNKRQPTNDIVIIKKAYRTLAKKHHPDRGGEKKQMQKVSIAGQTLTRPEEKKKYDQELYKDTIACKENSPGANFCGETGIALDDESLKKFAQIASIESSSSSSEEESPRRQGSSSHEEEIKTYKLKIKIQMGVHNQFMKAARAGNMEAMNNFRRIMDSLGDVEDMKDLKRFADFAKYA
jgi:DnaJ-class molecular chaperone